MRPDERRLSAREIKETLDLEWEAMSPEVRAEKGKPPPSLRTVARRVAEFRKRLSVEAAMRH
jgi:hypothetical protein